MSDEYFISIYIQLHSNYILVEGVSQQMESWRKGFNSVFAINHLSVFRSEEINHLISGQLQHVTQVCYILHKQFGSNNPLITIFLCFIQNKWQLSTLLDAIQTNKISKTSSFLTSFFEILTSFTTVDQKRFLKFTTEASHLPIGGKNFHVFF